MCSTVRCSEYTFEAAVLKNKTTVQLRENLLNCTEKSLRKLNFQRIYADGVVE